MDYSTTYDLMVSTAMILAVIAVVGYMVSELLDRSGK